MAIDIGSLAEKKVAGVPLPVVGAVMAAGAVYAAVRMPKAEPPAETPEDTGTAPLEGDPDANAQPVFIAGSPGAFPTVGVGSAVSANTTDTNDAWVRRAVEWLVAQGNDISVASRALSKYVDGAQLTYEEGMMRDAAVRQFGLPPETVPTGKTNVYKGPASKQGEPPVSHVVKGVSDDTFQELSRLYYGMVTRDTVNLIEAANAGINQPLAIGSTVRIPKYRNPKYYRATRSNRTLYAIARKNDISPARLIELNDRLSFPVKPGTRVRVA